MSGRPNIPRTRAAAGHRQRGFSLLEVLVALAILSIAVLTLTGLRTESLVTGTEARNLRVAKTLAKRLLSEIRAGQHKAWDLRGQEMPFEDFPKFRFKVLIGEAEIQDELAAIAEREAELSGRDEADRRLRKLDWLADRRSAALDEEPKTDTAEPSDATNREGAEEEETIDERTYEDVAVVVSYFAPRAPQGAGTFILRGRASTLALSGLTKEEAEAKQPLAAGADGEGR